MTRDKYIESLVRLKDAYVKESKVLSEKYEDNSYVIAVSTALVTSANILSDEILFLKEETIKELEEDITCLKTHA